MSSHRNTGTGTNTALTALLAAALFGATTPLAKILLGGTGQASLSPFLVAGLFYLGSGIGLGVAIAVRELYQRGRHRRDASHHADIDASTHTAPQPKTSKIARREWPWLCGAIVAGGVFGPALLMLGLHTVPSATTALMLNLESVFTALIAWIVFRESVDTSLFMGMLAIVAGGVALSWDPGALSGGWHGGTASGMGLIAAACGCWAIDNNLTRKVSANDAMVIACLKGLVAGSVNVTIAFLLGAAPPSWYQAAVAMLTGFAGYGVSLVLFVVALRQLGAARTGAYFSVAPVFGVALSLCIWPVWPAVGFWIGAVLMSIGVWLHIRERHAHTHTHEALHHQHRHRHDAHHQHTHDFAWDGQEPHSHPHTHVPLTHAHAHFPDIHHRHRHKRPHKHSH